MTTTSQTHARNASRSSDGGRLLSLVVLVLVSCKLDPPPPGPCLFESQSGCRSTLVCHPDGGCGGRCEAGARLACSQPAADGLTDLAGTRTCTDAGVFGACVPRPCALTLGVCRGKFQRVGDVPACDAPSYGPDFEPSESCLVADGKDNDCDGYVDEVPDDAGATVPCGVGLCLTKDADDRFKAYRTCGPDRGCSVATLTAALADAGYSEFDLCTQPNGSYGELDSNCDGVASAVSRPFVLLSNTTEASVAANEDVSTRNTVPYFVAAVQPGDGGQTLGLRDFDVTLRDVTPVGALLFANPSAGPVAPMIVPARGSVLAAAYRDGPSTIVVLAVDYLAARTGVQQTRVDAGAPVTQGPSVAAFDGESGRFALAFGSQSRARFGRVLPGEGFVDGPHPPGLPPEFFRRASFWGAGKNESVLAADFAVPPLPDGGGGSVFGLATLTELQAVDAGADAGARPGPPPLAINLIPGSFIGFSEPLAVAGGRGHLRAGLMVQKVPTTSFAPIFLFFNQDGGANSVQATTLSSVPEQAVLVMGASDAGSLPDGGLTHLPPALAIVRIGRSVRVIPAVFNSLAIPVIDDVEGPASATWSAANPAFALVTAPVRRDGGTVLEGRFVCMPPNRPW